MPLESFAKVNVLAALKALIKLSKIRHVTT
jgi:hypothetical protein